VLELPITLRDAASESQIPGRVVRSERVDRDPQSALWTLAIEFDRAPGSPVPSLERLGMGQAIGARVITFEVGTVEPESPAPRLATEGEQTGDSVRSEDVSQPRAAFGLEDELEQEEVAKDRRIDPRAVLARRQIPMLNEENGIVFGRDLSRRGVRIEPCALAVGDTLTLAIPGVPPEEPLLLRAVVARDEGPDGLIVRFSDPAQGDLSRLDRIVASLPPIEALADDPLGQECVVVVDHPSPERS
jgi:hypothetical protein